MANLEGMRAGFMGSLMAPYGDYNSDQYKANVADVIDLLGRAQAAMLKIM